MSGRVHAFRAVADFYYLSTCDKYVKKEEIESVWQKYDIIFTCKSEYLDWFADVSMNVCDEKLMHFFVKSEDFVLEFITNESPILCLMRLKINVT